MGKTKTIFIPQFNLSYIEGEKPVFLQVYLSEEGNLDIGFVVAEDEAETMVVGAINGQILVSQRLTSLFSRLSMFLNIDKTFKNS